MPTLTPFMQSYIIQYCLRWLEADFLLLKKQGFLFCLAPQLSHFNIRNLCRISNYSNVMQNPI